MKTTGNRLRDKILHDEGVIESLQIIGNHAGEKTLDAVTLLLSATATITVGIITQELHEMGHTEQCVELMKRWMEKS